jgi:dephospho-CoA kinase
MLRVGITGGMGSGKSTVCGIFSVLGIPVYNADIEAKLLYNQHEALKKDMRKHFGDGIYPQGIFDAAALRAILTSQPEQLSVLNSLVHPLIKEHSEQWFSKQQAPYAIKESALLIESLAYMQLQKNILVSAPLEIKMQRIQHRDAIPVSEIEFRMKHQFPDERKRTFCDYEIVNDEVHALIPQVLKIHHELLTLANGSAS